MTTEQVLAWWEVFFSLRAIKPVTLDKFTDQSVWVDGRRKARFGSWSYYPTWDEAHAALLEHYETDVKQARRRLEYVNGLLGNVKGMRHP